MYQDSPLSLHLPSGSIITRLDDVALAGSMVKGDMWTEYLTGSVEPSTMGWCVQKTDLGMRVTFCDSQLKLIYHLEKSNACCSDAAHKNTFPLSCFVSHEPFMKGCIDPSPVLTRHYGHGRCKTVEGCEHESVCTFPEPADRLMRITMQSSDMDAQSETVILWSGPRDEIYEESQCRVSSLYLYFIVDERLWSPLVQVGDWMPRLWFLPLGLPFIADLFWQ